MTLATSLSETGSTGSVTVHTGPSVTFTVIIIDPCTVSSLTAPNIANPAISLKVDTDASFTFLEAINSIETAQSNLALCGPRVYSIVNNDGITVSSWVSVAASTTTAGSYVVTASPRTESLIGT